MKRLSWVVAAVAALLVIPAPVWSCSMCQLSSPPATYRQDAVSSRLILFGVVTESRLVNGTTGQGVSTFRITTVIKSDPWLGEKKSVEIPRYLPVTDPKDPPKYVVFCDISRDKLDIYRGVPVKSDAAVAYIKGLIAANAKGTADVLRHCFDYLEHPDKELAADAYLEFAMSNDRDIGGVAAKLSADKLHCWLKDPNTPEQRIAMYAFLLGGCGGDSEARLLREMIDKPTERTSNALDGLLGGYIQLRPREGWDTALAILKDEKRPFAQRFAVVRLLRFYHGWKPDVAREQVMQGMGAILRHSDIADIAVEDLRRWQTWDLTADVLALYGKKEYDAPLMQRALVRYALTCPRDEAKKFSAELERRDPELYKDVAESLQVEKK